MKTSNLSLLAASAALLLIFGLDSVAGAQGRGSGRGNSPGRPTVSPGVDRGIITSGDRSGGRADEGRRNASVRSDGRSDAGIDRARQGGVNRNIPSDNELNRYRGISRKLGTTPDDLRAAFIKASVLDPDLKFGQFVAANVVAQNLNSRYPRVTSSAILAGLSDGHSLGSTLKRLRVDPEVAKRAEKEAKQLIKDSMR